MDLLRALPYDGFKALEASLQDEDKVYLDGFTEAVSAACQAYGVDHTLFSRRSIQTLFHQVDFHDRKFVTWEQITSHMIDDSMRVMAASSADVGGSMGPSRSELSSLDHSGVFKQLASARVRYVKHVDGWDRMMRVVYYTTGQESVIELMSMGSVDHVAKVSRPMVSPVTLLEGITDHNIIVAAHQDMSCSLHGAQVLREGPTATTMALHRVVPRRETEESTTALLWHPTNKVLYSGFRGGSLAPWNLRLDRHVLSERYSLEDRTSIFEHPISSLIPFEDKLVASSIASHANIALFDVVKNTAVERLKGHLLGVSSIARLDATDLIVSGGFERTPFLWILKIRDFPPWKLIDKNEPHRGNITSVQTPPLSNKIISADDRGMIKLWDVRTMRCVQTMFGDQPPPPKLHQKGVGGTAVGSHFHTCTFHTSLQTIVSCGVHNVHHFRGNVPEYMECTDDHPMGALLYHPTNESFYTAHGTTVKVWCQHAGAVQSQYFDVAPATITAMTFDNRGRKFFVGTTEGHIVGCNIVTGRKYRNFRQVEGEIVDMAYGTLRNGARSLLAVTQHEMLYYDDSGEQGRQQVLTHPLQHIRLQITKMVADPVEAEKRANLAVYRGITCQSKLSMAYVWARWYVLAIDLFTMSVVHCFDVDGHDVVAVTTLGDLPAVAVLDNKNVLHVYAVRPSLAAGTLLLWRDLSQLSDAEPYDKRTRHSITRSRRNTIRRHSEETFVKTVVSEFVPHDDTAPTGQQGSIMHFHQGKRVLYVTDSGGMIWEWTLGDFIKKSQLVSMHYPMQSMTEQVLRRRCTAMGAADALATVRLNRAYAAHGDEIRFLQVVFHNSSTRIVTGGADNRVVAWDVDGKTLGELSQGRFLHPEQVSDMEALGALYARYAIHDWRFDAARPDDDIDLLSDMPPNVLLLLRRAAARYIGRKGRFQRRNPKSLASGGAVGAAASPTSGTAMDDSPISPIEEPVGNGASVVDAEEQDEGEADAVTKRRRRSTFFAEQEEEPKESLDQASSINVSYSTFVRDCEWPGEKDQLPCSGGVAESMFMDNGAPQKLPLSGMPKAKFRVRGPLIDRSASFVAGVQPPLARNSVLVSPRGGSLAESRPSRHQREGGQSVGQVTQRQDLPLTSAGRSSQVDAKDETRERAVADALHMKWDVYSRVLLHKTACGQPIEGPNGVDFSRRDEAKQMRCVFVPQLPATARPTSRPSASSNQNQQGRQGRIPLTARDQEKFAVARLLGDDAPSDAQCSTRAMDDVQLHDGGSLRR